MWPLFMDSWGSWRCDDLNLGCCSFTVGAFYTRFIYIFDTLYSYNSVIRKTELLFERLFIKQNIAVLKNEKEKKKQRK